MSKKSILLPFLNPLFRGVAQCAGVCYIVSIMSIFTITSFAQNNKIMTDTKLYQMPIQKIQTKWFTAENKNAEKGAAGQANFGRKGSPNIPLKPGETAVLADIKGSGTINRMWFVLWKPYVKALRGIKLEIYWDNCKKPAVSVPFGDFLCQSHGTMTAFENIFFSSPEGRSFNCFIPMPFKKAAKIQLVNESDELNYVFYDIACTTGDKHDDNMLYFHSSWRRDKKTKMREDFTILPKIEGKGKFLGCHLGVIQNPAMNHFWWGEGEIKVYLDGDTNFPSLCGTGTEDYIGAGYGQGKFDHLYQGNHYLSAEGEGGIFFKDRHGYYRFHVPDPIYFYKNIRVDIQVMGGGKFSDFLKAMDKDPNIKFIKTGKGDQLYTRKELKKSPDTEITVERSDDCCATAYWYMDSPTNNLPEIASYKERVIGIDPNLTFENTIHGESIVLAKNAPAIFLFDKIIPGSMVVRNNYDTNTPGTVFYKEGVDYIVDYKKGEIKRTKNSKIPDFSKHELFGKKNFDQTKVKDHANHPFFVWMDYETENDTDISKPIFNKKYLEKSFNKLDTGQQCKIIVFGDSISMGAEATEPRFTFFERFKQQLQKRYPQGKITLENGSTGGDTTKQGLERLEEKVLARKPDLVLLGFGMNDHNINSVTPEKFYKNLKSIVQQIKNKTGADVLIYSTFPSNPNWIASSHNMEKFAQKTKLVAKETKSAYADVYSIWKKVLKRKNPSSLLGNNINHPNNFGHWLYSQAFIIE